MISYVRDRFLNLRLRRDEKEIKIGFLVTGGISVFLLANVIYLNLLIISNNSTAPKIAASVVNTPTPTASSSAATNPQTSHTIQPQTVNSTPLTNISTKDYYINLGSGTNQSTDWTDVQGTFSTFDIAGYPNTKEVNFETTINVPTANGTVSVRLFNKTGNVAVWNSERTVQSQANGDLLISQPLIYDNGPRLYSVQIKSQLGVPATLVQSRVHIITR